MARFKVGDRARFARKHPNATSDKIQPGDEVKIVRVGRFITKGGFADYKIESNGFIGGVCEWQLETITDTKQELGSWQEIEDSVGWSPVKNKEVVNNE